MSEPKFSVTPKTASSATPVLSPCSVPYRWKLHVGRYVSVYFDKAQPRAVWENHNHQEAKILVIEEAADCLVHWESKEIWHSTKLDGYAVWILAPGVTHRMEWDKEAPILVFYVAAAFVSEIIESGVPDSTIFPLGMANRCDPRIPELLRDFRRLEQPQTISDQVHVESLSSLVTISLLRARDCIERNMPGWNLGLNHAAFSRVERMIEDRIDQRIRLSDMAKEAGMSVSHFVRLFKQHAGTSPGQYLIRKRIQKSKTLLINRDARISEIAYSVGFSNQGHFDLFFKRWTGKTPSEYRAQAQ